MEKMIYSEDRLEMPKILDEGEFEGRYYYILNLGTHPTAYVRLKPEERVVSKDFSDYWLDVHGGPTFCDSLYKIDDTNTYIGWDYAHFGDFIGCDLRFERMFGIKDGYNKKWTTEEIFEDVKNAIRQLNNGKFVYDEEYDTKVFKCEE